MSDAPKFNPVLVGDSLANLKTGADFVDDGIPVPTYDHDRSVSASPPESVMPDAKKPTGVLPKTEELLALNATAEGRAKVAAILGVKNREATGGNEIVDIPARAEVDALNEAIGGDEGLRNPASVGMFLREAAAALDLREEIENGTPDEILEIAEMASIILSDPDAAMEFIAKIDNPANRGLVHKMICNPDTGRDAVNFIYRARQVANGEAPTGLPKDPGDGHIY